MKGNSRVREISDDVLALYLVTVAIKDEIAAEVTAMAMGWAPVEGEDGARIWVRSNELDVNDAQCCSTALEVVRTTHAENMRHKAGLASFLQQPDRRRDSKQSVYSNAQPF